MFRCGPDMTIAEMKCSFPSPRELWNAADSDAYMAQLITLEREATAPQAPMPISPCCIRDFVDSLMQEDYNHASLQTAFITVESLFVVITGKYRCCQHLMDSAHAMANSDQRHVCVGQSDGYGTGSRIYRDKGHYAVEGSLGPHLGVDGSNCSVQIGHATA